MAIIAIPASDLPIAATIDPADLVVVVGADGKARQATAAQLSSGVASAVVSVNGEIGAVVLSAADVGAATAAQGALADSALQPGEAVVSDPSAIAGADVVVNVVSLTTAEYAAIAVPDAATLYVITDAA